MQVGIGAYPELAFVASNHSKTLFPRAVETTGYLVLRNSRLLGHNKKSYR